VGAACEDVEKRKEKQRRVEREGKEEGGTTVFIGLPERAQILGLKKEVYSGFKRGGG